MTKSPRSKELILRDPYTPPEAGCYRTAAELLWGEAGSYIHDVYDRLRPLFPHLPESFPMVINLMAYGRCIGLTRSRAQRALRISIASNLFKHCIKRVDDVVLHEMMHLHLIIQDKDTDHDSDDWYAEANRLAPTVLGRDLNAVRKPERRSIRVQNPEYRPGNGKSKTLVRKENVEVEFPLRKMCRFPEAFREHDYSWGRPIEVFTY